MSERDELKKIIDEYSGTIGFLGVLWDWHDRNREKKDFCEHMDMDVVITKFHLSEKCFKQAEHILKPLFCPQCGAKRP